MVLLVCAVTGIALAANIWKAHAPIRGVRVEGNHIVSGAEIRSLARVDSTQDLYAIDLFAVEQRVRQNPFVRSASVRRDVTDGIVIGVVERVPIAGLIADRLYFLDADGVVLPASRSDRMYDLPVITGADATGLTPGKILTTPLVREALAIITTARRVGDDLFRRIAEVHVDGAHDIILTTSEFGVPVVFGHGNVASKLVRLDGFWNDVVLRTGAHALQYVDLRYDDQVVVRWKYDVAAEQDAPHAPAS